MLSSKFLFLKYDMEFDINNKCLFSELSIEIEFVEKILFFF